MKTEQAFPNPHRTDMTGMTLRDYFATKAMEAIMTRSPNTPFEMVAKFSYDMADAMLKAREA